MVVFSGLTPLFYVLIVIAIVFMFGRFEEHASYIICGYLFFRSITSIVGGVFWG